MNQSAFNSFEGGMNKDAATSQQPKNSYIHAENIRINTENGESQLVITNVNGTEAIDVFPAAYAVYEIVPDTGTAYGNDVFAINTSLGLISFNVTGFPTTERDYFDRLQYEMEQSPVFAAWNCKIYREDAGKIVIWMDDFTNYITGFASNVCVVNTLATRKTNFHLLGSTNLRDDLVVFTTSHTGTTGGDLQIWTIAIDPITNVATYSLKYHRDDMNCTTEHPIRRAVVSYETLKIQRVYFTDWFNPPRVANLADENLMGYDPDHILLQKLSDYNKPIIESVYSSGGRLLSGVYQYAYRLKSEGYVTKFSPLSDIVHVVLSSETTGNFFNMSNSNEYNGTQPGIETAKSIKIRVDVPDEDYDTIEFLAFYRESANGTPRVFQFAELPINNADFVSAIHTANEESFELDYGDLISYGMIFEKAKEMVTKEGALMLMNVKLSDMAKDLTFCARAYRWKRISLTNTSTYLINPDTGTYDTAIGANPYWSRLGVTEDIEDASPHNRDAFNPFNLNDDDLTYPGHATLASKRYIYQTDGRTVGGEGPFVKYKFVQGLMRGDAYTTQTLAPLTNNWRSTTSITNVANQEQTSEGTWFMMKSPIVAAMYRGYHPGEIYRFGIVLYDHYGRPGFVNWIGDIRFPEMYDPITYIESYGVTTGSALEIGNDFNSYVHTRTLGVEFTVNIPPDLRENVSGYSIVRVKRLEHDRTRIGIGLLNPICAFDDAGATPDLFMAMAEDMVNDAANTGCRANPYIHTFDCPDINFNSGFQRKDGDRVRVLGLMDLSANINSANPVDLMNPLYGTQQYHKFVEYTVTPYNGASSSPLLFEIQAAQRLGSGEVVNSGPVLDLVANALYSGQRNTYLANYHCVDAGAISGTVLPDSVDHHALSSSVYAFTGAGIETTFLGFKYDGTTSEELFGRNTRSFYWNLAAAGTPTDPNTLTGTYSGAEAKVIASYERTLINQYGGYTEEARSRNTYIRCSDFIPLDPNNIIWSFSVFGGDTYVDLFGISKVENTHDWNGGYTTWGPGITLPQKPWWDAGFFYPFNADETDAHYQIYPATSQINFSLRNGFHLLNKDNGTVAYPHVVTDPDLTFDEYNHEPVYSSEDDIFTFIAEPFNKVFQEDFDTRIYASNTKILGEEVDSWSQFLPDTRLDVESQYGQIQAATVFKDHLLFFQDDAFGIIQINPQALAITDVTGTGVNLGRGSFLNDYQYISMESGTRHQLSVLATDTATYFFDVKRMKMRAFKGQDIPLSDIKGMTAWFKQNLEGEIMTKDNWLKDRGVIAAQDTKTNDVYFTFLDAIPYPEGSQDDSLLDYDFNGWTIGFNEMLDKFTSFYSFLPRLYLCNKKHLVSLQRGTTNLHIHGIGEKSKFYGTYYPSKVMIRMTENPQYEKVYDNIAYRLDGKQNGVYLRDTNFSSIRCYTSYQNTDFQAPSALNSKRRFKEWWFGIPRNRVLPALTNPDIFTPANLNATTPFKDRLRDFYITEEFIFNNADDIEIILHYIRNDYRINMP